MPHTPTEVWMGRLIQLPMQPLINGGVDRCPGVITSIVDPEPAEGGGIVVRVHPFLNVFSFDFGVLELAFGAFQVLFCEYEEEARAEGFTGLFGHIPLGCWPLDRS